MFVTYVTYMLRTLGVRLQDMRKRLRYDDLFGTVHRMPDDREIGVRRGALVDLRGDRPFSQHSVRDDDGRCVRVLTVSAAAGWNVAGLGFLAR